MQGGEPLTAAFANLDAESPPKDEFVADVNKLVERGVKLSFVYGGSFPSYYSYAQQFRDAFAGEPFLAKVEYRHLPTLDHMVSSLDAQRTLQSARARVGRRFRAALSCCAEAPGDPMTGKTLIDSLQRRVDALANVPGLPRPHSQRQARGALSPTATAGPLLRHPLHVGRSGGGAREFGQAGYDNAESAQIYDQRLRMDHNDYPSLYWIDRSLDEGLKGVFDVGGAIGIKFIAFREHLRRHADLAWLIAGRAGDGQAWPRAGRAARRRAAAEVHRPLRGWRGQRDPAGIRCAAVSAADPR